ncbi:sigma-70 family RNA polymerase sigma factor [Thalassoroseus pseudoceratinae]|uniref:sigma-70 family RNA polymerase sigma factor n=1 Tax=Thalassoroseus pseudoceratinae TaxID=2713176 RepID=UPI00141DB1FC|nr:sigma-70 family RNA polymerase sigma factor [Thalassoroseus pseudoceratinae]
MWPDSEETQKLLQSAGEGDPQAINHLMERHRQSLRRMVQLRLDRALAGRVDASDVVQDVLIEANTRLDDFVRDGSMPFHLWLRQLAKDRIIDMHRRHRGAQRRSVDREEPMVAGANLDRSAFDRIAGLEDPELTPAAASIRRELESRFLNALDQLQEDDREIVMMRHYEHLSNSDVATTLGLSPAAAGMRYLRALRKLRSVLGEQASGA